MSDHPLLRVDIVDHENQRYDTCGDWRYAPDYNGLEIKVSRLPTVEAMLLVAIHEAVEAILCYHRNIPESAVTEFDKAFAGDGEPGDDPRAPYHAEHRFATTIERMLARELGVDWDEYERALDALEWKGDR